MDRLVGGLLISQIPGDKNNVPLCILEGPFPSQQAQVWTAFSLFFVFFKNKQQKPARNKNLTSGLARILFWTREVCALSQVDLPRVWL